MRILTKNKQLKNKLQKAIRLAALKRMPLRHIKIIVVFDANTYENFIDPHSGTYHIQPKMVRDCSSAYLASLLIHENQHCIDWVAGKTGK